MIPIIPHVANPLYPLPPDYVELTEDGQRQARRAAASQWQLHDGDPVTKAQAMVASLRFFDQYYLCDDPEDDFYPMFYRKGYVPSAQFHYDILGGWAAEQLSLCVCPRGSAKSTLAEKTSVMELVTAPGYEIVYATNNHDNAKRRGYNIRLQTYDNQRISDDWSPVYGRMKPTRGDLSTGVEYFFLSNLSSLKTASAQSGLRGGRPHVFYLDDPENDEKASTSMVLIRAYMERLLFGIIAPMVMQPGCSVRWLATFVSKRHYAYSAMDTVLGPDGIVHARDPRFDHWYRMLVRAAYQQEDGTRLSCWKEMWPATIAEKKADPALRRRVSLEEIEARIGSHRFLTEYMGKPGESEDSYFRLDQLRHGYEYEGVDEELQTNPRESNTQVVYYHQGQKKKVPMKDLLRDARTVIPCDSSYTANATSDYKACALFALTAENQLFVFDLWAKKCHEDRLANSALHMADRWRCPSLRPETVKQSYSLYETLKHIIQTRANDVMGTKFLPSVKPFKPPPTIDKTSKIGSLSFRFEHDLIKLPFFLRQQHPWSLLFEQIDGFNPDADQGGLQHDDCIDLVAMAQMCFEGRPGKREYERIAELSPVERLKKGMIHDDQGLPIANGIDLSKVSVKDFFEIMQTIQEGSTQNGGTRI